MHLALSCPDADEVLVKGWGEYHPLAGMNARVPPCLMMIYAPRTQEEIAVTMSILKASYLFTLDAGMAT